MVDNAGNYAIILFAIADAHGFSTGEKLSEISHKISHGSRKR